MVKNRFGQVLLLMAVIESSKNNIIIDDHTC